MLIDYIKVLLISAVVIVEQRGAIPIGIFEYGLNPYIVMLVSFLGSLLPVPFILLLFNIIFKFMQKFKFFYLLNKYIDRKLSIGTKKFERYEYLGLLILVAIPLPTTGMWTGSAVAAFLKLDLKKSLLMIALGGMISAIIITALCFIFPAALGHFQNR